MGRILPKILALRDSMIAETVPDDIKEETKAALEYAQTFSETTGTMEGLGYILTRDLYQQYVIKPLQSDEGERLWQRTKIAYEGCSMEVIIKSLNFSFERGMSGIAENRYYFCSSPNW
jgi:hypothetical protein